MIDEETVKGWLRELEDAIKQKEGDVARLRIEIAADLRREQALKALLAGDEVAGYQPETSSSPVTNPSLHPIEKEAMDILEKAGKPLHVSHLRYTLAKRGIPIPGKGTDANVIVYLARSERISRVGKGLYALRAWGVPEVPPRRRRRTRARRRAKSKAS